MRHQIKTSAELLAKADVLTKKLSDGHVKSDAAVKASVRRIDWLEHGATAVPTQMDSFFEQLIKGP